MLDSKKTGEELPIFPLVSIIDFNIVFLSRQGFISELFRAVSMQENPVIPSEKQGFLYVKLILRKARYYDIALE